MKKIYSNLWLASCLLLGLLGCREDELVKSGSASQMPIQLSGEIDQLALSRVNDNGFCDGDVMGGTLSTMKAMPPARCRTRATAART